MSTHDHVHSFVAALPIVEVTLLEDRALVVRRGQIELPPGRARIRVERVSPVIVDKTLAAALALPPEATGAAGELDDVRVRSVSVTRRRITRDSERPTDLAALIERCRAVERELVQLDQRRARLAVEHGSLERLLELTLAEISEDVGWARDDRPRWTEQLDQLEAAQRELALAARRATLQHEDLTRELQDLAQQQVALSSAEREATAELELELSNPGPVARRAELTVDYLVPGALWRPWHTARLRESGSGPAKLEFTTAGAVWQNTGEDWHDVELHFSTERPSLGVTPPTLTTDSLAIRKKSATVEVEARDQTIHTAGLGPADTGSHAQIARDELPGIDDGGEPLDLRGRVKASVPSDGRPHRVPIFSFEAPAEAELICVPEQVEAVMLRSRHANASAHPLLAGPVDLIRHSGLVGRTSILFIAPGERFELGWGPDPALRVSRSVELLPFERKMMSSWTRKPRCVRVKLSNLAPAAARIEVRERIAVSEIEKVEVELTEASLGVKADADGFVTWSTELKGFAHTELALTWVLVVHDDVAGL